jgi:hypothetical protein
MSAKDFNSEVLSKLAAIITNQDNQQKILDQHSKLLKSQGETLLRNTITVEEHHKRSTNLEMRQDRLESELLLLKSDVATAKSNKQYLKNFFLTVGYFAAGLPAIGGVLWGAYQILKKLGF